MSEHTQTAALKPCPFCGETPKVRFNAARSTYSVSCRNHECSVQPDMSFMFEHERHAIAQWNQRVPAVNQKLLDAARDLVRCAEQYIGYFDRVSKPRKHNADTASMFSEFAHMYQTALEEARAAIKEAEAAQ